MTLWTLGTLLWLILPSDTWHQLAMRGRDSLQRLDPGVVHLRTADPKQTTPRTEDAPRQAATDQPTNSVLPASSQPLAAPRSVYRTTAEQLYRDYEANVVATQTKIGPSRVRLTGNVAAIELDTTGRPVVNLWTGKDSTAAMTLAADQRVAAAQLAKGQPVEIECDQLGRSGALLQGSDCTLALVDFRPKEVNLAFFVADENGTTRVYVVGPMTEADCVRRSAELSSRLTRPHRGEHVVSRNCTESVPERISTEGCRLNASPVSVADLPTAHLWRYDCSSIGTARANHHKRTPASSPETETTLAPAVAPATTQLSVASSGSAAATDAIRDSTAAQPIAVAVVDAVATPAGPAASPAPTATSINAGMGPPAAPPTAEHITTGNIRLASASNSDIGVGVPHIPAEESTVAHAPQSQTQASGSLQVDTPSTIPAGTAATADDLARVRATDPGAANHIASYCAQATNRDISVADCRRSEADAWSRLAVQNEFPKLDEATWKKCSEPPFPNTYVAMESCARHLLQP
jgi:hypothetical protein